MRKIKPKFAYDDKGKKVGVVVKLRDFERLIDKLEDISDYEYIEKYGGRKTKLIPLELAVSRILKSSKR